MSKRASGGRAFDRYAGHSGFERGYESSFLRQLGMLNTDVDALQKAVLEQGIDLKKAKKASSSQRPTPRPPVPVGSDGTIEVETSSIYVEGTLVSYAGTNLTVSDATTGVEASWYVVSSGSGVVILKKWLYEGDILETGTGDDGTGRLYLYTGGGVTRNIAQIIDTSTGQMMPGVQLLQAVGDFHGLSTTPPESGYLRGSIYALAGSS